MPFSVRRIIPRSASLVLTVVLWIASGGMASGDDYVRDKTPSSVAKAYFAAVPENLSATKVARRDVQNMDDGAAYYTEDGSISIPPRSMVSFKMSGKCMDPHLPAPAAGEPMQFVDTNRLIPARLRDMYDNLISRQSQGDLKVLSNNPQHLVWAIRTAGTDDPLANNLSEAQLDVLDECAGRRGAFLKYHEKEKKRNARKNRKRGGSSGDNRISVGGLSYDASELTGTGGVRRIESHISALTEMGEKSTVRTENDFRYGEIEEELYSDITCDGGLSFTAKILNASEHRKEFLAADFVAQVGNGSVKGGMRQRVTMCEPDEITVIAGALREGIEIDRDVSIAEIEAEATQRIRGRARSRRTARSGEGHTRTERTRERSRRSGTEETTVVEDVLPVPPVSPVQPVVTNTVVRNVPVSEDVSVRVVSLEYDEVSRTGTLIVDIERGSFKKANKYIRDNLSQLVRNAPSGGASKVPSDASLEIESIMICENDICKIMFDVK